MVGARKKKKAYHYPLANCPVKLERHEGATQVLRVNV
jgi:hypothetical protein